MGLIVIKRKPIFQFVAAEAVVAVIAPNEKTIVADNAAARIFVLILFVFFMMMSPLDFCWDFVFP